MADVNRRDLARKLAWKFGSERAALSAVDAVFEQVAVELVARHSVIVTGFGVFEVASRRPRTGRNPQTGELVPIGEKELPVWRPGRALRRFVGDPSSFRPGVDRAGGRRSPGVAA